MGGGAANSCQCQLSVSVRMAPPSRSCSCSLSLSSSSSSFALVCFSGGMSETWQRASIGNRARARFGDWAGSPLPRRGYKAQPRVSTLGTPKNKRFALMTGRSTSPCRDKNRRARARWEQNHLFPRGNGFRKAHALLSPRYTYETRLSRNQQNPLRRPFLPEPSRFQTLRCHQDHRRSVHGRSPSLFRGLLAHLPERVE